jgi:hypothetical protein
MCRSDSYKTAVLQDFQPEHKCHEPSRNVLMAIDNTVQRPTTKIIKRLNFNLSMYNLSLGSFVFH